VLKIIYITIPNSYKTDRYAVGSDSFFLFGMGKFFAKEFIGRGYNAEFEFWRTDRRIKTIMEKQIEGGICKIFPALGIVHAGEFSLQMVKALKKEKQNKSVVFHFLNSHILSHHFYAYLVRKNRVFSQDQGNPNPLWKYTKRRTFPKSLLAKAFYGLLYVLEKKILLKPYNYFFTICQAEIGYYNNAGRNAEFLPRGISNQDSFKILDKNECREKIGLPKNKKIILQVGRATKYRGFDWLIDLMDQCKGRDDLCFVMAGINKWDPYYEELKKRDCIMFEHIWQTELVYFYNSADVFIFLILGEKVLTYGGVGYVPLEALSCGTPVIATSFHHIKEHEIDKVGRIPSRKEELLPLTEELLANAPTKEGCREFALSLFSWDNLAPRFWQHYNCS